MGAPFGNTNGAGNKGQIRGPYAAGHAENVSAALMGRSLSLAHRDAISNGMNSTGLAFKRGRAYVRLVTGWLSRAHAVWIQANGPVPKGTLIHHGNEIINDDRLENLTNMTRGGHAAHHIAQRS
jgi:hypothetical protein